MVKFPPIGAPPTSVESPRQRGNYVRPVSQVGGIIKPDSSKYRPSQYRVDYVPYKVEKPWKKGSEEYKKPEGDMETLTSYNQTYTGEC